MLSLYTLYFSISAPMFTSRMPNSAIHKGNEDYLMMPSQNGMHIITPEISDSNKAISIKEILKLPMNVYFQIPGGTIQYCNEHVFLSLSASSCGFYSHLDLIGINADELCKTEYVQKIKKDDAHVIQSNQLMIFEEDVLPLKDDISIPMLSFKFPCYTSQNQPPIIFGLSIALGHTYSQSTVSLPEALTHLLKLGILTNHPLTNTLSKKTEIEGIYITSQQTKCLQLAARGMTAKRIAKELGISYRTVERHFENIKYKLKIRSKSELIEKFINSR